MDLDWLVIPIHFWSTEMSMNSHLKRKIKKHQCTINKYYWIFPQSCLSWTSYRCPVKAALRKKIGAVHFEDNTIMLNLAWWKEYTIFQIWIHFYSCRETKSLILIHMYLSRSACYAKGSSQKCWHVKNSNMQDKNDSSDGKHRTDKIQILHKSLN